MFLAWPGPALLARCRTLSLGSRPARASRRRPLPSGDASSTAITSIAGPAAAVLIRAPAGSASDGFARLSDGIGLRECLWLSGRDVWLIGSQLGWPPVPAAEQHDRRRHQQSPDQERIHQDAERKRQADI